MRIFKLALLLAGFSLSQGTPAYEGNERLFRFGFTQVAPNDDSSQVLGPGNLGLLSSPDGVEVESGTALGLTFVQMLGPNLGLELLAASPFKHDINGSGALAGLPIGETKQLPPTLSLQYYFDPGNTRVQPYVGAGINYTRFFSEKTTNSLNQALSGVLGASVSSSDIKLDDSWGLAAQIGADWQINERWFVNTSVWYIDIDTEADVFVNGNRATTVDVEINPWVFLAGVGIKFN